MRYASLSPEELIRVCAKTPESAAWEEFVHRFQPVIATIVYRVVRSLAPQETQVIDDIIQDIYVKFCADDRRLLRRFTARDAHSTFAFIRVVAANAARDYVRARLALRRSPYAVASVEEADVPAPTGQVEREILVAEVYAVLEAVAPGEKYAADRTVFWLYFRQGLTARAISELPSVSLSESGVESTIHRLVVAIRSEIARGGRGSDGKHTASPFLE